MSKLTKAQHGALEWMYVDGSRRRWRGHYLGDPSSSALTALVRKGLARKRGGTGDMISFQITDLGRRALSEHKSTP